jgi:SAM-dependent methyltransferase
MSSFPPVLNIGCGQVKIPNSVGVDIDPKSCADVIHDLDIFPWPFPDQAFDRIVCWHVIEHVRNPRRTMSEIARLAKPGAKIEMATPHYSSPDSWGDMTHYHHFSLKSFQPFYIPGSGAPPIFDLVSRQLKFGRGLPSLIGRAIAAVFGLPFYEKYCCFVFRAGNMEFEFRRR